jgi:MinD-like ATPase involved in chromosome partitioning or flagellar assembly
MKSNRILMYSFKGGSGRTVTSTNLSYIFASEMQKKVLFVDLDVESSGSTVLFNLHEEVKSGNLWTIQDIFRGYVEGKANNLGRQTISVGKKDFERTDWENLHRTIYMAKDGYLKVVPARIILTGEQEKNARDPDVLRRFEGFLQKVAAFKNAPELVIFDSASGQQESALAGLLNCHTLVIFVRWTRQFIIGTLNFMEHFLLNDRFCPRIKSIMVVPAAVPYEKPAGRIGEEVQNRMNEMDQKIAILNQRASQNHFGPPQWIKILDPIHECTALKWDDRIFPMEGGSLIQEKDIKEIMREYRQLANQILHNLEGRT